MRSTTINANPYPYIHPSTYIHTYIYTYIIHISSIQPTHPSIHPSIHLSIAQRPTKQPIQLPSLPLPLHLHLHLHLSLPLPLPLIEPIAPIPKLCVVEALVIQFTIPHFITHLFIRRIIISSPRILPRQERDYKTLPRKTDPPPFISASRVRPSIVAPNPPSPQPSIARHHLLPFLLAHTIQPYNHTHYYYNPPAHQPTSSSPPKTQNPNPNPSESNLQRTLAAARFLLRLTHSLTHSLNIHSFVPLLPYYLYLLSFLTIPRRRRTPQKSASLSISLSCALSLSLGLFFSSHYGRQACLAWVNSPFQTNDHLKANSHPPPGALFGFG